MFNIDNDVKTAKLLNAIHIDVRTKEEYLDGHIPDSINIPLDEIDMIIQRYKKQTLIYLSCRSGARSQKATEYLIKNGFTNVKNIGGIIDYHGEIEK